MKMRNKDGQTVYFNSVEKRGAMRFVILALDGQTIYGRDRERHKSRTFVQEHQAIAWLRRNGYEVDNG